MYKRNVQGWAKNIGFMLLDMICLQVVYIVSVYIRHSIFAYSYPLYKTMAINLILVDAIVLLLNDSMHEVLNRGYYIEIVETFKHSILVFAITTIYMFATQSGDAYSRIILFLTFIFHFLFGYLTRIICKIVVSKLGLKLEKQNNMLVVTSSVEAESILDKLSKDKTANYKITGVILTDDSQIDSINSIPVVANLDSAADYIVREWVDSVYIDASISDKKVVELMDKCTLMAIPTHYHVKNLKHDEIKRFSEQLGGTTVLTTSISFASPFQLFIKRVFDIFAGIIGSIFALLIIAVVGPIIKSKSPGPILFAQERIGKNGKRFKMYKIRSMYMDAEERKKELMNENRVKDGMMFKLDFDPRIIGNEILPDGTKKTGIGEFIRKTSLDEFPQFFNVLGGSMSTVGTRPPTVDEYEKYHFHHRARMSVKPGVTGMWQVNGRSEITDFEEVVKLDTSYIVNWNLLLDLKILFKTVKVIFTHKGAM